LTVSIDRDTGSEAYFRYCGNQNRPT